LQIINRVQIIEAISAGADISNANAERALDSIIMRIIQVVSKNEAVRIGGLGSFIQISRSARLGRNPSTGTSLKIAASKLIIFRASEVFKRRINHS